MDEDEFEPLLGRMRSRRSPGGRKYLHSVLEAAARAGMPKRGTRPFAGSRIARGGVAARALALRHGFGSSRARRAIVKTRLVRLTGKGLAAASAHLRYIQRDGASREGEPGRLYSAVGEEADGRAFTERCSGDRHQFRFIVSAEDGAQYEDLRPLVRRFMTQMEEDLGTRLDWVAADHVDTSHPHTHIMLRGRDERGENLVIAPDYIKHGMRERLAGLVTLDLGPRTDVEIERRLRVDLDAERLTSTDRRLLRAMDSRREVSASGKDMSDHSILTGRLRKLESLGLAERLGRGRWRLDETLEPALRRLGEKRDIIRTMQRALSAAGIERAHSEQLLFQPGAGVGITGRVVARGLSDELADRRYLVVDGIDGRSHYVEVGKGEASDPLPFGAIIRIRPRIAADRDVDRRIARIAAANGGIYSLELHLAAEPGTSPGSAKAHVRRLEAVRRSIGGVDRLNDGSWSIPSDYTQLARRHEQLRTRSRPVEIELLSALPLERLSDAQGATWLDRKLTREDREPVRDSGFGREVRSALSLRRAWLVDQGLAKADSIATNLIAKLERRELSRVAAGIAVESGKAYLRPSPGNRVEGTLIRRLDLVSGRFALIENDREFLLVPWKPVLERALGRQVSGLARRRSGISWSFARDRGLEI